jgi:hypothetical protein
VYAHTITRLPWTVFGLVFIVHSKSQPTQVSSAGGEPIGRVGILENDRVLVALERVTARNGVFLRLRCTVDILFLLANWIFPSFSSAARTGVKLDLSKLLERSLRLVGTMNWQALVLCRLSAFSWHDCRNVANHSRKDCLLITNHAQCAVQQCPVAVHVTQPQLLVHSDLRCELILRVQVVR